VLSERCTAQQEDALSETIRRWFGAVLVAMALLVPGAASAQDVLAIGQDGIVLSPLPGLTIRLPAAGAMPAPQPAAPVVQPQPAPPVFAAPEEPIFVPEASGRGRAVGVFVGISDYPGHGDLPFCASDAIRVQQAFVNAGIMSPLDTVVLTDHQATRVAVSNALDRLMRRIGPDDTLVFFFSGHGSQIVDQDRDELDGTDETIALWDGAVTDDELATLLATGQQRAMVALDSCYSGGFARDVARLADSVGFYASREDQLSHVAPELQAGGYLSYYLADAVDRSGGQPLPAWQLRSHLADGFATSQAAGRQDLTWGVSRGVNTQTVLFARERGNDAQLADSRFGPSAI
jgi:hypothetical protein